MTLVATMTFDDEDPDVHAHFTVHAHVLEADETAEWARVLGVFADSLREYADKVEDVALKVNARLETEAAARAQLGRDQHPVDQW
jgi:hypothetical protein